MSHRKPYNLWTESDLQALIDDEIPESLHKEYKSTISIGEKKKLCKAVSAFANAYGGAIVFGLKEKKRTNKGSIPEERTPISDSSLIERLENILLDSVQPRMEFIVHPILSEDNPGSYYYILDVPKSRRSLHMVQADGRYYIRRNYRAEPMDALEIEDAFRGHLAAGIDIDKRIEDHTFPNPNEGLPRPLNSWLSVTAVPYYPQQYLFEALIHLSRYELGSITLGIQNRDGLFGREEFSPVNEGLISTDNFEHPGVKDRMFYLYRHIIFREGAVHLGMRLNEKQNSNSLHLLKVLRYFHTSFAFIAGLFDHVGYRGPLEIGVDLRRIKHLMPEAVKSSNYLRGFKELTFNNFHRRISTSVPELAEDSIPVIQPVMDHLCQAGGQPRCVFYRYDTPGVFDDNWVKVDDGYFK